MHDKGTGNSLLGVINHYIFHQPGTVDSESDISTKYGITSIPTLLFFKDGEIVDKHIGPASKLELENKLNALI